MVLKTKAIRTSLASKGFVENRTGHHIWFRFYVDEKKTKYRTKLSHGDKEIGDPLIKSMARQLDISHDQFAGIVSCTVSASEVQQIYREKLGH